MSQPSATRGTSPATSDVRRLLSRWETDVVLSDGGTVKIRPIVPDDAELIVKLHASLSPETIYFRFFSPIPRLSDALLQRFVHVDYIDRMAFVAILGDAIVAVARYDRLPGSSQAEVAFLVSDAHQGRGLGTIMLELLAARASEAGITRFLADTLPENLRMLRVFREAGYTDSRSYEDGLVRVVFDITPTFESVQLMHDRERQAVARSVGKILSPASVAVVGAGTTKGSIGNIIFRNILDSSFTGTVFPVNQRAASVSGVKSFKSLLDVPDDIDLAVIAVPAQDVRGVITDAGEKGVGGLVIISSGFSETGADGAQLERELVRFARSNGMRIVGPNCMGVASTKPGISLNATLAFHPLIEGRSSLIAHSGALGLAIVEEARRRGIGLSSFVSSGNRADVSGNDLLQYWELDDNTDVILLYLESFGNPRSFVRIARRLSRSKPIVAVKAKRISAIAPGLSSLSSYGSSAQVSATPGLLGTTTKGRDSDTLLDITVDEAVDAMFVHTGVLRVNSLEELFTLGHALETQPLPRGPKVAILANTGGPSSIAQDALELAGLQLSKLASDTLTELAKELPKGTRFENPVELPADADPQFYKYALEALLRDANVDSVLVLYVPTPMWQAEGSKFREHPSHSQFAGRYQDALTTNAAQVALGISAVASGQSSDLKKPVLANFLALPNIMPALKQGNSEVPLFEFPELAAEVLGRMWEHQQWKSKPSGRFLEHQNIDRAEAARFINRWLKVAREGEQIQDGTNETTKEVSLTEEECRTLLRCYGIEGSSRLETLNEEGEPIAVDLRIAVVHDRAFGPFITMQIAGILTDLLNQKATGVLPLTDRDADELLAAIPGSRIFEGYRSIPKLDLPSIADLLSRLSRLIDDHFEIATITFNPLIVAETGYRLGDISITVVDWAAQANYVIRGLT